MKIIDNMFSLPFSWLLCLVCVQRSYGLTCDSFKNVIMELHQKEGAPFNKTISGCIERIAFDEKTAITKAFIRNQNINTLGQDSIRNMARLKTVSFAYCNLSEVSSGAFRNVPRLINLQISDGNLKTIQSEIFITAPSLELIKIYNNVIDKISDHSFANLPSVKKIYANHNNLDHWRREWFTNTTNLELLDFQHNKIKSIPERAFYGLTNLTEIYFDFNEISSIQTYAFKSLRNITYLGLRHNRLTKLTEDIFPNTVKINSLLLDANYLNYLPHEFYKRIVVKELTIHGNPWKCPCLNKITSWLYDKHATLKKLDECSGDYVPDCAFAKVNMKSCVESVDLDLTKLFIDKMKNLLKHLNKNCAQIDDYVFPE